MMNNNFEKELSGFFKNEVNVFPTKNIAEEAILKFMENKKNNDVIKNKVPILKFSSKRYAAVIICVVLIIGATIAASADIRNSISELIHTIFTIEKQNDSYVVVEKNADDEILASNFGGVSINHFNIADLISILGFEPFYPEKLGSDSIISAELGIQLRGTAKDLLALRNNNNAFLAITDESLFNSMKEYEPVRILQVVYSENGNINDKSQLIMHMSKTSTQGKYRKLEPISDFDYKGIKCSYIDDVRPDYHNDDATMQPKGILHIKHITFKLDEISYSVSFIKNITDDTFNEFDYDKVKQFVIDYIDAYMSK